MLKNKIIKLSTNSYAFIIISKKNKIDEGINRICINYLLLNNIIEKNSRLIFIIKKYLSLFYKIK